MKYKKEKKKKNLLDYSINVGNVIAREKRTNMQNGISLTWL